MLPKCLSLMLAVIVVTSLLLSSPAFAADGLDATMMRYPDVSDSSIAFVYDNDVWTVPKGGGIASPLSSPPGQELHPKFSPDGQTVAYSANYDGNSEVYTLSVGGGTPQRLTYHPSSDRVIDYAPDGRVIIISYRGDNADTIFPAGKLYLAGKGQPLPEALPVAYGFFASISDDGKWLAFTPWTREFSTWNRYQGGLATDIWLFNLETYESKKITDHPGTDDVPMFHGNKVYYLSDGGPENRRNIWVHDVATGKNRQVTKFADHEVKWPSIGPKEIVFENGGKLYLLNLGNHHTREVKISVPGDHPNIRAEMVNAADQLFSAGISPNAKRLVVGARGDIWTLPAEEGFPRNLTRTDGVADRFPNWSPDGKWVAYFSDETGEYELYMQRADGSDERQQLTTGGKVYRYNPQWSPDSKLIAFSDKTGSLFVHTVEGNTTTFVDRDPWGNIGEVDWASDSNWFVYASTHKETSNGIIMIYDVENNTTHQITSHMYSSYSPTFDKNGDFVYFATNRSFSPMYSNIGDWGDHFFANATVIAAAALRADVENPFAPENDEEEIEEDEEDEEGGDEDNEDTEDEATDEAGDDEADDGDEDSGGEGDNDEEEDEELVEIELDGIEARAYVLPLDAGNYGTLYAGEGKLFYMRRGRTGSTDRGSTLFMFDMKELEETEVLDGVGGFTLTPDASKMLVYARGSYYITDAGSGAKLDKQVSTAGMNVMVDPANEWPQMVHDAWRIYRDFFYDANMHGVDWDAQLKKSLAMVKHAACREDVTYIIGNMVSELNVGHAYVGGGAREQTPYMNVGLLGCDYEYLADGNGDSGFCITKILSGAEWDYDIRGALSQPGIDVAEGEFLLAVNGIALGEGFSPYQALAGMSGRPTMLTVGPNAVIDDESHDVLVEPDGSERELRLRSWIEANRQHVFEQSGGKIGYIYVRNTSSRGFSDFRRQFTGQYHLDGLIVDERWNGGGLSPMGMIDMLSRDARCYFATRDSANWRIPQTMHNGPKALMINHAAGSGGDMFPWLFRQAGIGKLVGTRTWGGLVGISGNPQLIDGSYNSVPTFGIFEPDGTWAVEGWGVSPDVEVIDDPTALARGIDPQLAAAIKVVLDEIEANPPSSTGKPVYPDRSGAGTLEEER